jgi:hypothetical protein
MSEIRPTRRRRGIVQNFANQLAQMAVGWQAMFDGPALVTEPAEGTIVIDAIAPSALINGHPAQSSMAVYLNHWITEELDRAKLDRHWLASANVTVTYRLAGKPVGNYDDVALEAVAEISTVDGTASSSSINSQAMLLSN